MTAVAAFRARGVPVLIGDLMISSPGASPRSTRKLRRISRDVVLGWTGHLVEAGPIVSALEATFAGHTPTHAEFERLLACTETVRERPVSLTGWIRDQAFKWDSGHPDHVTWSEMGDFFIGSGGAYVEGVITHALASNVDDPEHLLIGAVATLLADESGRQVQRRHPLYFGVGYEILIRSKGIFAYLDNFTVIPIDISDASPPTISIRRPIYKMLVDDETVIFIHWTAERVMQVNMNCAVGRPRPSPSELLARYGYLAYEDPALKADYYAFFRDWSVHQERPHVSVFIATEAESVAQNPPIISFGPDQSFTVNIPIDQLTRMSS